ncbi:uncharacterized protein L201_004210 [Kwoniella dendrophila CBS 6074]|uniref:Uncharacterized protein n=1 Tax=Kwoniella dendrophila CBS 6074 TaxID=1295534 RepID=A0AAX4JWX1_9TREE
MTLQLEPIEIAAISLASIAVIIVISYVTIRLSKSRRESSPSSPSIVPIPNMTEGTPYGNDSNNDYPYLNYRQNLSMENTITPVNHFSRSPLSSAGQTTLITPSTSESIKQQYLQQQQQQQKMRKGLTPIKTSYLTPLSANPHIWKSPQQEQLEDSMLSDQDKDLVVVTYEDGLRSLNAQNQHNISPLNVNTRQHPFSNQMPESRPQVVGRDSSRRIPVPRHDNGTGGIERNTSHTGSGGSRNGRNGQFTNTMNSNLLPSYYIQS